MKQAQSKMGHMEAVWNVDVMNTLVKAIEAKDPYTAGHVWRVSQYVTLIVSRMGWERERIAWIEAGALLHDLGKIGVTDTILQKEGKLNEAEYEEMKQHPVVGSHLLESSTYLSQYRKAIESHHEQYDGDGYPFGLAGEDIPIEGRIIAVADTFDALTSHRPYRKAMSSEKAIQIIEEQTGQQFDPAIVDVFVKLWWQHHFRHIILHSAPGIPLAACPEHGEIIEITAAAKPGDQAYCPACKASFQLVLQEGKWLTVIK